MHARMPHLSYLYSVGPSEQWSMTVREWVEYSNAMEHLPPRIA